MPTATTDHSSKKPQFCQASHGFNWIQRRFSFLNPEAYDEFGWRSRLYKESIAKSRKTCTEGGQSGSGVDWFEVLDWFFQGQFGDQIQSGDLLQYLKLGHESEFCGQWAVVHECPNGHRIAFQVYCGREWCPVCGQKGSQRHKRKASRMIDRVFAMNSVGYFVFEVPVQFRSSFQDKQALQDARRYLHRLLKREGVQRGVSMWHFYGEFGVSHFNPHLNLLIDGGYIGKRRIQRLRKLWSQWISRYVDSRAVLIAPIHYQYSDKPGKLWHWIRYVTRATFTELTSDNRRFAFTLIGFKNVSWFGEFSESDKARGRSRFLAWLDSLPNRKDNRSLSLFAQGHCPICGAEFMGSEVTRIRGSPVESVLPGGLLLLESSDSEDITTGVAGGQGGIAL